jgi:hypothetical protein
MILKPPSPNICKFCNINLTKYKQTTTMTIDKCPNCLSVYYPFTIFVPYPVFSIHYPKFDYDCYDDLINNNNMLTEYYLEITNKKYYLHKLYLEDNHIFNDIISTNNIALSKITPSNFQKKLKTILTFL